MTLILLHHLMDIFIDDYHPTTFILLFILSLQNYRSEFSFFLLSMNFMLFLILLINLN
jgi:hypothetical protein